jgi:hypothetical protein
MIYAANPILKRKFKQGWLIISPISTKTLVTWYFKSLNITTKYGIGNLGPSFGQEQKCGRDKPSPNIWHWKSRSFGQGQKCGRVKPSPVYIEITIVLSSHYC